VRSDPETGTGAGGPPTNVHDVMRARAAETRHRPENVSAGKHRRGAERQRSARGARRECKTVRAMVEMYCRHHHRGGSVCPDCQQLLAYVRRRLDKCPFGIDKPTCVKCPIHCYRAVERERIREIMRWAGPRMSWRHPVLALMHLMRDRWLPDKAPARAAALKTPKHLERLGLGEGVARR